jgi:predicted house-cleaning noncanonical NTP pyrophosphatase (MazG superfamily)
MPKFLLNKLVRDNIIEHQQQTGQNPVYRQLDPKEHVSALADKVIEEAQEIPVDNKEEAIKEIADVQQVLDDLKASLAISDADVARAQKARHAKVGGFSKGMYVESVSPAEDNTWTTYYRTDPKRFIEVSE